MQPRDEVFGIRPIGLDMDRIPLAQVAHLKYKRSSFFTVAVNRKNSRKAAFSAGIRPREYQGGLEIGFQ